MHCACIAEKSINTQLCGSYSDAHFKNLRMLNKCLSQGIAFYPSIIQGKKFKLPDYLLFSLVTVSPFWLQFCSLRTKNLAHFTVKDRIAAS